MGVPSGIPFSVRPFLENMSHHGISSSVPNSLPSLLSVESMGGQSGLTDSALAQGQLKFDFQGTQSLHPHSLPEYQDGLANGAPCNPVGTMAANINPRPERIENRQLSGANSNGLTVEHNDGGKCDVSLVCFHSYESLPLLLNSCESPDDSFCFPKKKKKKKNRK